MMCSPWRIYVLAVAAIPHRLFYLLYVVRCGVADHYRSANAACSRAASAAQVLHACWADRSVLGAAV